MSRRGAAAVVLWLGFLLACLWVLAGARYTADLSAFLPRTPTEDQQLLIDQLRSGVASRLILLGIEGGDPQARIRASRELASRLRADRRFVYIANGETSTLERDRELLLAHRYLLSPAMTSERFTVEGLRAAIQQSVDLLAGSAGLVTKALLPRDPTGELLQLLAQLETGHRPAQTDGVWVSRDGRRALLLARTRAEGSDTDGQAEAVAAIREAFRQGSAPPLRLDLTGPGPFSVAARAAIKGQVLYLSGLGSLIIVLLLLGVYRSAQALVLGLLPVVSGALGGAAAVAAGFGVVHGVTLGFGAALIGEAVDYSIYLLVQSQSAPGLPGEPHGQRVPAFWPTIRIGVLTSVIGFASLLFSGFPGLAQLGLYAIAGLVTAALVTRFVLPSLLPRGLRVRDLTALGTWLQGGVAQAGRLRWLVLALVVAACAVLLSKRDQLWSRELAALSPVPPADQALDASLRADLGAPDVRYLVVVTRPGEEAALAASEQVADVLRRLQAEGLMEGFEGPSTYLPSQATQRRRLAGLPPEAELRLRFSEAIAGLPLRPERFEPFFADVARAREQAPLSPADVQGSFLGQALDALLWPAAGRWTALLPLRLAAGRDLDAPRLRTALADAGLPGVHVIDVKGESDRLYQGYLRQAIALSLAGLGGILVLLLVVTRSPARVLRILAPLVAAVAMVAAALALAGQPLTILHLVGMLLVVAVGSNYALFFDRGAAEGGIPPRVMASLLIAAATTLAGFGVLGLSSVPVLNAIGSTVGPGAILALTFSAVLAQHTAEGTCQGT